MDAEVGQWSARRRRVNELVAKEQANSVRIGHTETHDDALTLHQWALILSAKVGELCRDLIAIDLPGEMSTQKSAVELAALTHSYLESLDRRIGNG